LELERKFNRQLVARERETERLVTQWRRDLEQEIDAAQEIKVCGPADVLSDRTRQRLRSLAEAPPDGDPGQLP
jgi:hypothetical protein